jgi:hypothetical protein
MELHPEAKVTSRCCDALVWQWRCSVCKKSAGVSSSGAWNVIIRVEATRSPAP